MTVTAPITSNERIGVLDAALAQQARSQQDRDHADRHVDEEDPLPAGPLGEHAAEQHARGATGAGDGAPHAERLVALLALGEGRRQDREGGRRDQRGAQTLHGARRDQQVVGVRQAAGQRGDREERQADHEHLAAAEQVGHAAAEQQEAAEGERVGARDPLQARVGEVQVALDRRQRDVHDRDVDDEHELRRAQQDQSDPAARIGHLRHVISPGSGSPGSIATYRAGVARTRRIAIAAVIARAASGHR